MISVNLIQDTRREKNNKKYPVKLCVNFRHKAKYYATDIDLTVENFKKVFAKRTSLELAACKNEMQNLLANAREICKSIKPFSFSVFERKMLQKPTEGNLFESTYRRIIAQLRKEDRVGTAASYENGLNRLLKFKQNLCFEDITVDFLREFEQWMVDEGKSRTTVGIYLRALRAIFNEVIAQGDISRDHYPFGRRKYQIPSGRNVKKALSLADIGKIYYYELKTEHEGEARAKDFWLFTYFANGINMKDIALLKYKNIQDGYIVFERAKTLRTMRSNPRPISIYITEDMWQIIDRQGNKPTLPDSYIFPVFDPGADAERRRLQIQQFTRVVNIWMRDIAKSVGIEKKVTTYTARHSFSTIMKRSGASVEFISEALGHTDVRTTESYLDSFENETKKQFANNLTAFKKDRS